VLASTAAFIVVAMVKSYACRLFLLYAPVFFVLAVVLAWAINRVTA
jgi:hypothetical protein